MHKIASQNIVVHAEQEDAPQEDGVHLYDEKDWIFIQIFILSLRYKFPIFKNELEASNKSIIAQEIKGEINEIGFCTSFFLCCYLQMHLLWLGWTHEGK